MKKSFSFTNKKTATASAIAVVVIAFTAGLSFVPRTASGGFDIDGLNQVMQDQGQTLKNHEARISNTEADVTKLQNDTGGTPAAHTAVPGASPSATPVARPSPTPAVAPVAQAPTITKTVAGSDSCINGQDHQIWIDYYSDGTTKQREVIMGNCTIVP